MDPLKFPIKKATSDTSTIIISRDEFANRATKAIAESDIIKGAIYDLELAPSLIAISSIFVYEVEKELFGEGGEEK